jgi:NAD(P)-dependent dehydrogenase (short-subunit alcohol dehydrogenase family)
LKTLAIEWPEVRMKVVDLCLTESVSELANQLMTEIHTDDSLIEVGYSNSRRMTVGLVENPLGDGTKNTMEIDSSWVILVTGGARGITAEVAQELARRYRPTLILAGRSSLPPEKEPEETSHLVQPHELKSALIAKLKHEGKPFQLTDIEAAYKQLCKEREIRSNLVAMQSNGAKVEYFQVDVRNQHMFGRLIDDIYETYGRLDGVIHGAGIIEDKLFKIKAWESFDRVFGTKTESVFVLSQKLRPETLKFLALFSSVAGRFGNPGQCDYTAANEVFNKVAVYLDRQWPGRVLSINWGPWEKAGMVSAELQEAFARRGVRLIPPSAGSRMFHMELLKGRKGEVESVIGDGPWGSIENLTAGEPR